MLKNKKLNETFGGLQEEGKLSRPPKGFDADVPHIEYVKMKSFIVWQERSLKKRIPENLNNELLSVFKAGYPLVNWLRKTPL